MCLFVQVFSPPFFLCSYIKNVFILFTLNIMTEPCYFVAVMLLKWRRIWPAWSLAEVCFFVVRNNIHLTLGGYSLLGTWRSNLLKIYFVPSICFGLWSSCTHTLIAQVKSLPHSPTTPMINIFCPRFSSYNCIFVLLVIIQLINELIYLEGLL